MVMEKSECFSCPDTIDMTCLGGPCPERTKGDERIAETTTKPFSEDMIGSPEFCDAFVYTDENGEIRGVGRCALAKVDSEGNVVPCHKKPCGFWCKSLDLRIGKEWYSRQFDEEEQGDAGVRHRILTKGNLK